MRNNMEFWQERVDLAAAFRWTARLNMHEGVANHFSLAINDSGTKFLMNPNQAHFSRIKASDLIIVDADDPETLTGANAPDPTAWGLHGGIHRGVAHARCCMHVHSIHATVLATLADSHLPPIDQNACTFYGRHIVDTNYGGLAFEEEGARCATLMSNPKDKVMILGNHGIMIIGDTVAETFNRLYYFERACETYIRALQTGQPLRIIAHDIATKTSQELADYPEQDERHLSELKAILIDEGSNFDK